jgi:uracil-DNA glycosylase
LAEEVSQSLDQRKADLDAIAAQVSVCTLCSLHQGRTRAVPGAGPVNADILFIGEGPGFHEDKQGLPFVGASGKYLEQLLDRIGLNRRDVFITNVVKCRPPENRDPLPTEVDICTKTYLFKQLDIIRPKVIVTLGRYSMGLFFPGAKITQIHGQVKWDNNRAHLPLFHPAAALRNDSLKPLLEADFMKIPSLVEEHAKRLSPNGGAAGSTGGDAAKPDPEPPPSQLSLF